MALTVKSQETRAGVFKLCPAGSLDSETYAVLEKSIDMILKHAPTEIVLDMESVHYMSSAGIRIILKAKRDLKSQGGGSSPCESSAAGTKGIGYHQRSPVAECLCKHYGT